MRTVLFLLAFFSIAPVFSQKIIDSLSTDDGLILIYENRTWTYEHDQNFDGIMNYRLTEEVEKDTAIRFFQSWDHDVCYTSNLSNDLNKLKDTIWLCVQDSLNDDFVMPFNGIVTSHFGWRRGRNHNGTDIDLETGDTVRAAWSGKIRYAKYNTSGFGNLVVIRHYNGLETFYAHLHKHLVVPNQIVQAGDPIGLGGNTGHSYGAHLHFEVRFYDLPIDSEKIIDFAKKEVRDENLFVHRGLFGAGGTTTPSTPVPVATEAVSATKYYRIRSGDTLSSIAARNRTTVSKICQLNGIRPTAILQIGRNLRIR